MGVRKEKQQMREKRLISLLLSELNNCPTSPRKMRLVADLVRGQKVERALNILRFSSKEASRKLEIGFIRVIANWQAKTLKLIWKKRVYLLKRSL
jgi:large subunit ribosomal protein L22